MERRAEWKERSSVWFVFYHTKLLMATQVQFHWYQSSQSYQKVGWAVSSSLSRQILPSL